MAQPERHVLGDVEVRKQRKVLKHEADSRRCAGTPFTGLPPDEHRPPVERLEPCDRPEQHRLAGPLDPSSAT